MIGTNASFMEFLQELSDAGYETHYLTYKDKRSKLEEIENLKYLELPFYFDRGNNFDKVTKTYLWIFLVPLYVRYLQQKHGYDIVYCDDSVPYYSYFSKVLSPASKLIMRLGDLHSGYNLADDKPFLFKIALKIETFMWSKMDGVLPLTEDFKKFIVDLGVAAETTKVVEESINMDYVDFAEVIVPDTKIIMFHGAIVKCKGVDVLLDAYKIVKEDHPDASLIIAGGGGEEENVKRYARELGVKGVTFTGWYDHETLAALMRDVQISIAMRSPNIANNFVVTTCLLENWAFKKPVVAPNLKAFSKVIDHEENGLLFTAGDPQDLADQINRLLDAPQAEYESMILRGLDSALNTFSHRKIARKMVTTLGSYI